MRAVTMNDRLRRRRACGLLQVFVMLAALVVTTAAAQAHHAASNTVVAYLDGAERQAESAEQEHEIARALQDLRSLPAATLATRRYADYALTPERWTLAELVRQYFVPRARATLDPATFYRDAQDVRARAVIDAHLAAIREHRQVRPLH